MKRIILATALALSVSVMADEFDMSDYKFPNNYRASGEFANRTACDVVNILATKELARRNMGISINDRLVAAFRFKSEAEEVAMKVVYEGKLIYNDEMVEAAEAIKLIADVNVDIVHDAYSRQMHPDYAANFGEMWAGKCLNGELTRLRHLNH